MDKVIKIEGKYKRIGIPPMTSLPITNSQNFNNPGIKVWRTKGNLIINVGEKSKVYLGTSGIEKIEENGKSIEFSPQVNKMVWKEIKEEKNIVEFEGKTEKGSLRLKIYSNFIIQGISDFPFTIKPKKDRNKTTYHFGPIPGWTVTYHLDTIPTPSEPGSDIVYGVTMKFPLEWSCITDKKEKMGLWCRGNGISVAKSIFNIPSKTLFYLAPLVLSKHLSYPPMPLAQPTSAFKIEELGLINYFKTTDFPVLQKNDEVFKSLSLTDGKEIIVQKKDRNNFPDFTYDKWEFLKNGKIKSVYKFYPYKDDPFKEGNVCYISLPLNKEGTVDKKSEQMPVYKLVDWNKEGTFLEGSIFSGGLLQQDCFYYNQTGSPYKTIWNYKGSAYDLNGAGQCNIYIGVNNYNFIKGGITNMGTADATTSGIYLNYSDRPYAFSLIFHPFKGEVNQKRIGYDFYLFHNNACSTTAYFQHNGIFIPTEEHMQYNNFYPKYGEGHLWTYNLAFARIVMGGLGGWGKWKVGMAPGANWPLFPPAKPIQDYITPKIHIFTDPWGHTLKIKSFFIPDKWDGNALKYKERKYSLDYSNSNPWGKGVNIKAASMAYIESPKNFGVISFEAYVGNSDSKRGRYEWARQGRTTGYFYYSPLTCGLDEKGISFGFSADNKLYYFDRDKDGIVDTYIFDKNKNGLYNRRLWYYPKKNLIIFYDNGKSVEWNENLKFPGAKFYLENFGILDKLYKKTTAPLVETLSIGNNGLFLNNKPVQYNNEKFIQVKPVVIAYDSSCLLKPQNGFTDKASARGISFISPIISKFNKENNPGKICILQNFSKFNTTQLKDINILVITEIEKPFNSKEISELKDWIINGGILIILHNRLNYKESEKLLKRQEELSDKKLPNLNPEVYDEYKTYYNLLLNKLGGIKMENFVNYGAKIRRIPWQTNIAHNVAANRHPTKLNRVSNYSTPEKSLFKNVVYIAYEGYPLKIENSSWKIILSHFGKPILAEKKMGEGKIFVSMTDIFSNRWTENPIDSISNVQNIFLFQNFFNRLAGEIKK